MYSSNVPNRESGSHSTCLPRRRFRYLSWMVSLEHDKPLTPVHHQGIRLKIMWTFNCLSPQQLENQGDRLVSEAQQLLDSHWATSWPSRRQHAQELIAR